MISVIYIFSIILFILAVGSLSHKDKQAAAIIVILSLSLSFLSFSTLYELTATKSMAGFFWCAMLSMITTFISLSLYNINKETIMLKIATVNAVFTCVHMLYIMTYIEPIRAASWYYAPIFDKTYWYYGELQIILTLYMITLFGKSGTRGIYVGFNKARSYFNNVHSVGGGINTNTSLSSSVLVGNIQGRTRSQRAIKNNRTTN